jgi:hypothetical protein
MFSQPLGLYLKFYGKSDPHGMPIGFSCAGGDCPHNLPVIADLAGKPIVAMSGVKDRDTNRVWTKTNQENMYDDLIGWSKKHALTSPFYIQDYLRSKLHI